MAEVYGKIVAKEDDKLWVRLDMNSPLYTIDNALMLNNKEIAILVDDGIETTPSQRKFAFAVMRDIFNAQIGGYSSEDAAGWTKNKQTVEAHFKKMYEVRYGKEFTFKVGQSLRKDAENFIDILMEYIDNNNLDIGEYRPLDYLGEDGRYSHCYRSLMNNRCAICGKAGDLHHVKGSTIGSGNNRKKVNHLGRYAVELCRQHHQEVDKPYNDEKHVFEKYHIVPVKIDEKIALKHGLNIKNGADDRIRNEFVGFRDVETVEW